MKTTKEKKVVYQTRLGLVFETAGGYLAEMMNSAEEWETVGSFPSKAAAVTKLRSLDRYYSPTRVGE